MESTINFDNRNMIDDSSVLDNNSSNAGGNSFLSRDLYNLTSRKGSIEKRKKINSWDPDFIEIKRKVEKFEKKQIKLNEIKK